MPHAFQTHSLDPAAYKEALYHDCNDEITELAKALLEAKPNWTGFTPLQLTPARYGKVPNVYIECKQGRAVTLQLQRQTLQDTPCDRVYSMDTGHSPFFSQPAQLAQLLSKGLQVMRL